MATLIEPGYFGSEAGTADRTFVWRLRQLIRDMPVSANEQASGDGSSTLFQAAKTAIYDDSYTVVTVAGLPVPITRQRSQLASNNCFVDFDTGTLILGTAAPAGPNNIAIQHQRVRWSDSVLVESLNGGLRQLFPTQFKMGVDTSVTLQVNQWLYTLPSPFWDPRVRIINVLIQEVPSSVNRPVPVSGFSRLGINQIEIPTSQRYTPGATVWIEYTAPYRSLAELEPQLYELPLYYAAGQILGFGEVRRTNIDTQSPAAEASANPQMYQTNAGSWFMNQFKAMLATLPPPALRMPRPISTYER